MRWKLCEGETFFMIANHTITDKRREHHLHHFSYSSYFPKISHISAPHCVDSRKINYPQEPHEKKFLPFRLPAYFICIMYAPITVHEPQMLSDILKIFCQQKFTNINWILWRITLAFDKRIILIFHMFDTTKL